MYKECNYKYGIIGIVSWILYMLGLLLMGIMHKNGFQYRQYQFIYVIMFFLVVAAAFLLKRKDGFSFLGFCGDKLKIDSVISVCMVAVVFIASIFFSEHSIPQLLKLSLYYIFYIGAVEEIIFRGFIQNCLFGLKLNRIVTFLTGGVFFSLMHLPFQMYLHGNVSLSYLAEVWPNLIFTFGVHLLFCFIANKRKNIMLPIAIHYAINYLG